MGGDVDGLGRVGAVVLRNVGSVDCRASFSFFLQLSAVGCGGWRNQEHRSAGTPGHRGLVRVVDGKEGGTSCVGVGGCDVSGVGCMAGPC